MMRIGIETIKQVLNKDELVLWNIRQILNGGPGSGNFGHAGIPGQVGGSASGGGVSMADPTRIIPFNEVRSEKLYSKLVESMKKEGWKGDPILTHHGEQALTGSHRIAAAIEAGLDEIPTVDIPDEALTEEQWHDLSMNRDTESLYRGIEEYIEDGADGLEPARNLLEKEVKHEEDDWEENYGD